MKQLVICGACDNEYDTYTQDKRCPHSLLPPKTEPNDLLNDKEICIGLCAGLGRSCPSYPFKSLIIHCRNWQSYNDGAKAQLAKVQPKIEQARRDGRKEALQEAEKYIREVLDHDPSLLTVWKKLKKRMGGR